MNVAWVESHRQRLIILLNDKCDSDYLEENHVDYRQKKQYSLNKNTTKLNHFFGM